MFTIGKVRDNQEAFSNVIFYNREDFKECKYLLLDGMTLYPSISGDVPRGTVSCNGYIRTSINRLLGDKVKVEKYEPDDKTLDYIALQIHIGDKKISRHVTEHEANLKEHIFKVFSCHHFWVGQHLLTKYNNITYVIKVLCSGGLLGKNTKVDMLSTDSNLILVGDRVMKRDLFKPDYDFEQIGIGGLDNELRTKFCRALSTWAIDKQLYEKLGIKHVKGVLLYGPPGTGKTLIARKIGSQITHKEPKIVNGPSIMSKWVGQSEQNIRDLFSEAISDPDGIHVIIFDEIDAICKSRGEGSEHTASVVNQLLSMIDGVNQLNNIFIIAMTNRKDLIDPALLRAGRIELHIKIGLPDLKGREQIFRIHTESLRKGDLLSSCVNISELAKMTENFTGAEIEAVVKKAVNYVLSRKLAKDSEEDPVVKHSHLKSAIKEIHPTMGSTQVDLPTKYLELSASHMMVMNSLYKGLKKKFKRVLITSKPGYGRTTLVSKFIEGANVNFKRLIKPLDFVGTNDVTKINTLLSHFKDAEVAGEAILVLDDLDLLVNYVKVGSVVSFSDKMYHALITLLSSSFTGKLFVIATCSNPEFIESVSKYFDEVTWLESMSNEEIQRVGKELGIQYPMWDNIKDLLTL